jgi:hypothetical protein
VLQSLLSPLRGSFAILFAHGLRRGLYFAAASRLFGDSLVILCTRLFALFHVVTQSQALALNLTIATIEH